MLLKYIIETFRWEVNGSLATKGQMASIYQETFTMLTIWLELGHLVTATIGYSYSFFICR